LKRSLRSCGNSSHGSICHDPFAYDAGALKTVILAGGLGTRLSEETVIRPKPMVELGGRPVLWHIMKHYSHFGIHDFVICLGYKGYAIKEYFANYFLHSSDVTITLRSNELKVHQNSSEPARRPRRA